MGIVGLPVPDEVLMTFVGYLSFEGTLTLIVSIVVSYFGSITGMTISYMIGRHFGYPLLAKYGSKIKMDDIKLQRFQDWFRKRGKWAVVVGYFIPGVRHFTAYFAGIGRWPLPLFYLYASLGDILWVGLFVILGFYLGEEWQVFSSNLHHKLLLSVLGLGVIGLFVLV